MIRDWDEGIYSEDRVEHEIRKRARKQAMIDLSIKYNVASQWTSFIAVEKRKPGEVGPRLPLLVPVPVIVSVHVPLWTR
jgi:hypothetical protein